MPRPMKTSGIEWIGEIPVDWKVGRIKYNYYLKGRIGWQGLKADEFIDDGPFLVTGTDFKNGRVDWLTCYHISEERYDEAPEIHVKVDDLLITKDGTVGKVAYIDKKPDQVSLNSHLLIMRPLTNAYYNKFLFWVIQSPVFKKFFILSQNGTVMASLSQEKINDFSFGLPSRYEQTRIADFLDAQCGRIDEVIEKTRASIGEYKKLKQSVITRAVTKGIRPNRPLKPSGIDWIGDIPETYQVVRIKHLGTYRNGLTYTPSDIVDENKGILVLRSSNVQQGKLSFFDNVYVNCKVQENFLVNKGDIIICSRNGSRELIGKCAIIENELKASFGAFMMIFRSQFPKYMYYILNSSVFKYYLSTFLTATINQLTGTNFGNMEVVFCSDIEEQQEIIDYLDKKTAEIDTLIERKEQFISEMEAYKKSLIYEYVTGKKEVL